MATLGSKENFVGFVDILGFSKQVEWREHDNELSIEDLLKAMDALGSDKDKRDMEIDGPTLCPKADKIASDVDFQLTQISDCVIVSVEISPSGALAVVYHCWKAVLNLKLTTSGCAMTSLQLSKQHMERISVDQCVRNLKIRIVRWERSAMGH
jgi:metal-sulfur cluster biosynthetic enzyme